MANIVNNISQNYNQLEIQAQVQKDIAKTSSAKAEDPTQVNTSATVADNGGTDKVESSSKHSGTIEPAIPEDRDEAIELLEDTKVRLYEEAAIQSQNSEQIHNLNPGDLIDILA